MFFTSFRTPKIILATALLATSLIAGLIAGIPPAQAQNLFETMAKVDDSIVTRYEYEQRILLMQALGVTGDLETDALEILIDERLQYNIATRDGVLIDNDAVQNGIDEFALRADMTGDEFISAISQKGVDGQTMRDFVDVGLAWRAVVGGRFGQFVEITDSEVDLAITLEGTRGGARVLFSEIFLPTNTPENEAISLDLAPQITKLTSIDEFAEAARRFSAGESRTNGGRVEEWVPLERLPSQIRSVLLKMKIGEVTEPIEIPDALALFQLRGIGESAAPSAPNMTIDYAMYFIPGGRSPSALQAAAKLRARYDTCEDLYKAAQGQSSAILERHDLPVSKIPRDIALELARLDSNESSTALTRSNGQTLVYLMLCGRNRNGTKEQTEEEIAAARDQMRDVLFNDRLQSMAEGYLSVLRAEAVIVRP